MTCQLFVVTVFGIYFIRHILRILRWRASSPVCYFFAYFSSWGNMEVIQPVSILPTLQGLTMRLEEVTLVPPRRTKGYEPTHHKKPFYPKPSKKGYSGYWMEGNISVFWWICLDSYFVSTFEWEVVETFYSTSETVAFVLIWTLNYRVFLIASVGFDSNEGSIIYLLSKFLHIISLRDQPM